MSFKTYISRHSHDDFGTGIGWLSTDELVSCGDDRRLCFWNATTHELTKSIELPTDLHPTDLHTCPKASKQKQVVGELFAIASSDGKFHLISKSGKIEKSVEAHKGACLAIRWSSDGSALVTAGEDGHLKVWSKNGMLRSTLAIQSTPVYSVYWSPNSDQIIYTIRDRLEVKPLSPNSKPIQWKAHDGVILKVAWNQSNNQIVSGGEDCRYKVWDSMGRNLFVSVAHDYAITSLSWSPDGTLFAVASFNTLKLCDEAGWSYSLDKPAVQSVFNITWSSDNSQVAAVCGNGQVIFAYVVEKRLDWKSYEILASGRKLIQVKNVTTNVQEELEFRDSVVKFSMEFGFLLALTSTQCQIFKTTNWNSPHIFDLKDCNILLLLQCDKHFLLVDAFNVNLYSYEGRFLLAIKWPGMKMDALNKGTLSLSADTVAIRDANDNKAIHFIDIASGKPITGTTQPYRHKLEITIIGLDYRGTANERKCAFIDKNADLYILLVRASSLIILQTVKLSAMVKCIKWNEDANLLAAIQENSKLVVWLCPQVAFVDRELLSQAICERDSSQFGGKNLQLISFQENRISVRRLDGSLVTIAINPFGTLLHTYAGQGHWSEALRLCRYLKDSADCASLWAALAGMSLSARQLEISEVAYAAINRVDKVFYIQRIQAITSKEARSAEIALLCGNVREAENICLQHGLVLRAILLNIELHKWTRASELATKYDRNQRYLGLVAAYRQKFLERLGRSEDNKQLQAAFNEIETVPEWSEVEAITKDIYEKDPNVKTVGRR